MKSDEEDGSAETAELQNRFSQREKALEKLYRQQETL